MNTVPKPAQPSDMQAKQHWVVVASFFSDANSPWLDNFIDDDQLAFTKVAPTHSVKNWQFGTGVTTSFSLWRRHMRQVRRAFAHKPYGVISCFPQLSMCAAFLKYARRSKPLIIAYNFNLGGFPGGAKRMLARAVARQIDVFVVHSPSEIESYSAYLNLPQQRFRFIPLQRGNIDLPRSEETERPYVLAMGSAGRDYETLIKAVDALGIRTIIVTRASAIDALPQSDHVEYLSNLSEAECLDLLARARLLVTPIANLATASGQVTFVNALHLKVPTVSTRCPGTDGYIEDGANGILVEPFDEDHMRTEIERLWNDQASRDALAEAGYKDAMARMSDEAAAASLHDIMRTLEP